MIPECRKQDCYTIDTPEACSRCRGPSCFIERVKKASLVLDAKHTEGRILIAHEICRESR